MDAVLFTNHSDLYRNIPVPCRIVTDITQFHQVVSHTQPDFILIDSCFYSQHPPMFQQGDYSPTVVFATEEMLLKLLNQHQTFQKDVFLRDIPSSINKALDTALLDFCFSPSLKGYYYIKQACYYQYVNAHEISSVKKDIYESVSNCYKTSIYSVERGITFAIQKAYRENPRSFQALFPSIKKQPSNMAFLKTFFIYLEQKGYW